VVEKVAEAVAVVMEGEDVTVLRDFGAYTPG